MNDTNAPILVTGATGAQGGGTARALLAAGRRVRVLTRNTDAKEAAALRALGAEVVRGDFDDAASLAAAARGAGGVFSVQRPDSTGQDTERKHGYALVEAARNAGVQHFVHTSVCEAGKHTQFPRWESGYWYQKYWTDKWDIEEAVRNAGFARWTVLKPAFMMDNFAEPKVRGMFPQLPRSGEIATVLRPDTRMQMIAADDVGAFACAAFLDPARFDRQNIDMAVEALTMSEVASVLQAATGRPVKAHTVTVAEAKAGGMHGGWIRSQEWSNEVGYRADIAALAKWGVPLTKFAPWAAKHAASIPVGSPA